MVPCQQAESGQRRSAWRRFLLVYQVDAMVMSEPLLLINYEQWSKDVKDNEIGWLHR